MTRPVVRCRCGNRVLAKEVLRTDLYERPSGREYVYVKYRCKRCKRLGETFVAESRWDWRIFEAARGEMSETECEAFAGQAPISAEDILVFHYQLQLIEQTTELVEPATSPHESTPSDGSSFKPRPEVPRPETKLDLKSEAKNEHKARPSETGTGDDATRRHRPPHEG